MKKIIYSIVVLTTLLLQYKANAQGFRAGISAGVVATDVHGSDRIDNDDDFYKAGFIFGGAVSRKLSKTVTLRLELNYIQKGTMQKADSTGVGYYKYTFNYLEFPLMLKYRVYFNSGKKFVNGFDLHAGVSIGQMIKNIVDDTPTYQVNSPEFNKTDVSVLIGLGYNLSQHFNICMRYSNSVIPVVKKNDSSTGFHTSTINNGNNLVLHFILQYMFGGDKSSASQSDNNN